MSSKFLPIRLSHLIGQNGVGAIVRGPDGLMVVQDTRQWTDRQGMTAANPIPYVDRVKAALNISEDLHEPPIAQEPKNGRIDGTPVPASRFPSWSRCPKCSRLYRWPWRRDQPDIEPYCTNKNCGKPKLEQTTWVLADPKGYLSDVPWHYLTHSRPQRPQQIDCKVRDRLRLIEHGHEQREIRCDACAATNIFRGNEKFPFGLGRMQPWTQNDLAEPNEKLEDGDNTLAQVLTVNDSRVYSPVVKSALVIPPESRVRKGTVVDLLYRNSGDRADIDNARNALAKKRSIRTLATKYRCTTADISTAQEDLNNGYPLYGEILTDGQLRESEFEAFLEILEDQRDDEDLVTTNRSKEWHELTKSSRIDNEQQHRLGGIQQLVRVDRLKSVNVFKGFTRLGAGDENIVPPDIIGKSDWLPAIELYGEGIFIVLDENRLTHWEQSHAACERLDRILPRFSQSGRDEPQVLSTRFMLLHSLSHLLMRQIESEGGYPAASLAERLYCSNSPKPMAGILIHVAVPDVAGSLGGLAELAEPERFIGILSRALERSHWCSLDPVCSEHEGQGPGLLNRAACHACALVPEPACEYGNTLLDRGFVKGDASSNLTSFFDIL